MAYLKTLWGWLIIILLTCSANVFGQTMGTQESTFGPIDDRLLIETKWKYTYALHVESNTIIHQAENFYEYFLFLRFDYSYHQFLNGNMTSGTWSLNGRTLNYQFKNIEQFEIAELGKLKMVLEFTQPNAKGTYQYHFLRVNTHEAPFIREPNELPEVNVEAEDTRALHKKWWTFSKKEKKRKKRKKLEATEDLVYINVELIGGGYYGGIDPVMLDFIHIKSSGRLIKEFKSIYRGHIVTKKNISRIELEQFAEYVTKLGFFDFERIYDCSTPLCYNRKKEKPSPIPLRIAITYGDKKKVITISVWGLDEMNVKYVNYPEELDNIIDAIQRMANRMGDQIVKNR